MILVIIKLSHANRDNYIWVHGIKSAFIVLFVITTIWNIRMKQRFIFNVAYCNFLWKCLLFKNFQFWNSYVYLNFSFPIHLAAWELCLHSNANIVDKFDGASVIASTLKLQLSNATLRSRVVHDWHREYVVGSRIRLNFHGGLRFIDWMAIWFNFSNVAIIRRSYNLVISIFPTHSERVHIIYICSVLDREHI